MIDLLLTFLCVYLAIGLLLLIPVGLIFYYAWKKVFFGGNHHGL